MDWFKRQILNITGHNEESYNSLHNFDKFGTIFFVVSSALLIISSALLLFLAIFDPLNHMKSHYAF